MTSATRAVVPRTARVPLAACALIALLGASGLAAGGTAASNDFILTRAQLVESQGYDSVALSAPAVRAEPASWPDAFAPNMLAVVAEAHPPPRTAPTMEPRVVAPNTADVGLSQLAGFDPRLAPASGRRASRRVGGSREHVRPAERGTTTRRTPETRFG